MVKTALHCMLLTAIPAACYLANQREIGVGDTEATKMTCAAIVRGDGLNVSRFSPILEFFKDGADLPYFVARDGDVIRSRYPLGPAVVALPFFQLNKWWLDRYRPGWNRSPIREWYYSGISAKNAAVTISVAVTLTTYFLIRALGVGAGIAFFTSMAAALGSNLWMTAGQSLWQHGPAALALALALLLLAKPDASAARLFVAGLVVGVFPWMRISMVLFTAALLGWTFVQYRGRATAFAVGPVALGLALAGFNQAVFHHVLGGAAALESSTMHQSMHASDSAWSSDVLGGALGVLVSPSRGLSIFAPWVGAALLAAPWSFSRLRNPSLLWASLLATLAFLALLSSYAVWWGGYSFGPRYWTDVIPLFTVSLAACTQWWIEQRRYYLLALTGLLVGWSIAVRAIGTVRFPSAWFTEPVKVDLQHDRLWDWRDSELTRCLREKNHPPFIITFGPND